MANVGSARADVEVEEVAGLEEELLGSACGNAITALARAMIVVRTVKRIVVCCEEWS